MLTDNSCTLYLFNGTGYDRHFIPECHWQDNRGESVTKSGMQMSDSVTVYIPPDSPVPAHPARDIIVEGECELELNGSDEQEVSEQLKKFRRQRPDFLTIAAVAKKLYGSERMRHIRLTAR